MSKTKSKKPKAKEQPAEAVQGMPDKVADLAELARKGAAHVTGVDPDYSYETLPLLDMYLQEIPPDSSEEVKRLIITSAGCYFGEVVRRILNGRWAVERPDPEGWRIELTSCFMHFLPVGMAGEVCSNGQDEEYDGTLGTLDEAHDALADMLANATPYSEQEYYSLAGRVDVLQMAADWLTARPIAAGKRTRVFDAADYLEYLGASN